MNEMGLHLATVSMVISQMFCHNQTHTHTLIAWDVVFDPMNLISIII